VLEGRCHDGDPDVNVLTDAGVTDINHGATYYECLVEVAGTRPACDLRPAASGLITPETAERRKPRAERQRPQAARRTPQTGFVLDLGRCVGCSACVLACRLENGWSSDNPWRRVLPLNLSRRAAGPTYFMSVACHHCERPACVAACPSGAYEKRADGVVVHHESRCIGCRYCEMACPFGAPRFDAAKGVMTKCHLCHHRLDAGEAPACVAACPTEALQEAQAQPPSRTALRRASSKPGGGGKLAPQDPSGAPGFVDVANCGPNIRFVAPGGQRRAQLFQQLRNRPR
jgi:Fe-S-cluster-containing dehydrogenase component